MPRVGDAAAIMGDFAFVGLLPSFCKPSFLVAICMRSLQRLAQEFRGRGLPVWISATAAKYDDGSAVQDRRVCRESEACQDVITPVPQVESKNFPADRPQMKYVHVSMHAAVAVESAWPTF